MVGVATTILLLVTRLAFDRQSIDRLAGVNDLISDSLWVLRNNLDWGPQYDRAQEQVAVLAIDDESLRRAPERWPWSPGVFAELSQLLLEAGARCVVIDVPFRRLSREFQSLHRRGVFLSAPVYSGKLGTVVDPPLFDWEAEGEVVRQYFGVTLLDLGNDKVVREIFPVARLRVYDRRSDQVSKEASPVTALSLLAFGELLGGQGPEVEAQEDLLLVHPRAAHGKVDAQPHKIRLVEGRLLVNYGLKDSAIEGGTEVAEGLWSYAPTRSLGEVMQMGSKDLEFFRDRVVLVGITNFEVKPYTATPFGADVPGIYVEAEILASLIEDRPVLRSQFVDEFLMILLFGLLGSILVTKLGQRGATLVVLTGLFVWYGVVFLVFCWTHYLLPVLGPWLGLLLPTAASSAYLNRVDEEDKALIHRLFGGYLSPKVVDSLLKKKYRGELGLTGRKLKLTVFYSDIRGFTALSEGLDPLEVVSLLNEHFECLTKVAYRYDAYVDKFLGDSLMAVLSAPTPRPDDALLAVKMAIEMRDEISELTRARQARGEVTYEIGIGIHTDRVVLGNIGSSVKMDYTVIGDGVNLTSRLCDAAAAGRILISQATYEEVQDFIEARPLEAVVVKGKSEPVGVYEVIGTR